MFEATLSVWQFGKLLLDKYCLARERKATSMIDSYAVAVVENNDMTIDKDILHSMKISWLKLLQIAPNQ